MLGDEELVCAHRVDSLRGVACQYGDAFVTEALLHQDRNLRVFTQQQARCHLDLGHSGAQSCKGMGELAADWPAAKQQQPVRTLAQVPHVVRGQHLDLFDAR